ncbi:hypothetical protein [Streptomyces chartreusis]
MGGAIQDPVGWLIGKGLPQRQERGDRLCDDRMLLGSGRGCPRCEDRQAGSRARRHAVAAAVDTAMPYASEAERRTAAERQLHATVTGPPRRGPASMRGSGSGPGRRRLPRPAPRNVAAPWQVTLIDLECGRDTRLWPFLTLFLNSASTVSSSVGPGPFCMQAQR